MREGFSVSATTEALQQFLIPCAFCDELVMKKGDEMPILAWITRRGVQNLAQQEDEKSIYNYSEMADSHMKQRKKNGKWSKGGIPPFFFGHSGVQRKNRRGTCARFAPNGLRFNPDALACVKIRPRKASRYPNLRSFGWVSYDKFGGLYAGKLGIRSEARASDLRSYPGRWWKRIQLYLYEGTKVSTLRGPAQLADLQGALCAPYL